jgi:hypothetical protein
MIATKLLAGSAVSARERKAVMDIALLLTFVVTFLAVMGAWFYRLLDIDLGRLAWIFFSWSTLYLIGSIATDSLRSARAMRWWTALSSIGAVIFLAVGWSFAGGVKNPLFLLSMFVPVMVLGALQTRLVFPIALASIVAAGVSALVQSPELLWTAERVGLSVPFAGNPSLAAGAADPLPGVEVTPSWVLLVLMLFTLAQVGVAILSRRVTSRMMTLFERLVVSVNPELLGGGVSLASIHAAPSPTALVYSESGQIHLASQSFLHQMLIRDDEIAGKTLFEVISFAEEESVREILKSGGNVRIAYHVGPERRMAHVSVHVFHSAGETFSSVRLDEIPNSELQTDPAGQAQTPRRIGPIAILK